MKEVYGVFENNSRSVQLAKRDIVALMEGSPVFLTALRKVYEDNNREVDPKMEGGFDKWLYDVWAGAVLQEANEYCGGYTSAKAERIAQIEFIGTPLVREVLKGRPDIGWHATVEKGRVHLTFYAWGEDAAIEIRSKMLAKGYADAECVFDYDVMVVPVAGTRRFVP